MLKTRHHQSPCNRGPPMTPNQLRFRASSQKDHLTTNSVGPGLRMISRIKNLQHAKLYLFTRVTNTKSMTPNQLKFRASGFKGFRHIPLGPCSDFTVKRHGFHFTFSSFLFLFAFSFPFVRLHWSSFMGNKNLLWVVNRSKAGFARGKEVYSFSTYWYNLVCSV